MIIANPEIRLHQAEVLFLPAYSPDCNPIEKMWSKVKQILRGIKTTDRRGIVCRYCYSQPWMPSVPMMPKAGTIPVARTASQSKNALETIAKSIMQWSRI